MTSTCPSIMHLCVSRVEKGGVGGAKEQNPTWRHSYALTYLAIPLIHCHSLQFLHHPFTMYRGQTCKKLRMSSNLKQNILKVKKSHLLLINDKQSYANTVKVKI